MISFFFEEDQQPEKETVVTGGASDHNPNFGLFDIDPDPVEPSKEQTNTYLEEVVFNENPKTTQYIPAPVISPIFGVLPDQLLPLSDLQQNQQMETKEKSSYLDTVFSPHFRTNSESEQLQPIETSPEILATYGPLPMKQPVAQPVPVVPFEGEQMTNLGATAVSQNPNWQTPTNNQTINFENSFVQQPTTLPETQPNLVNNQVTMPQTSEPEPVINPQFGSPITENQNVTPATTYEQPVVTNLFGETINDINEKAVVNDEFKDISATQQLSRIKRKETQKPVTESLFEDFDANFATSELNEMVAEEPGIDDLNFNKFKLFDGD